MAILITYATDVNVQASLTKGNFDQMKTEVENLTKLSNVYLLTNDVRPFQYLFQGNVTHLPSGLIPQLKNNLGNFLGSIVYFLVSFVVIAKRSKEIDLVVSHGAASFHSAFASFVFRKPSIIFVHYLAYKEQFFLKRRFLAWIFRIIELFSIRHNSLVIALNDDLKSEAFVYGAKRVQTIPNFVDLEEIGQLSQRDLLRRKFGFEDQTKIILFVGRLHPVKNIDIILKSFSHINSYKCILVIIGNGQEKQHLIDLANSLNISDKVFFLGSKTRKSVLEYMKASDVLVLPSIVEGQPRVILEAWACGLPVVASRRPGLENLIKDNVDGLLFDLGAEEKLAETISVAFDDKVAFKIVTNAKKNATNYDVAKVLYDQRSIIRNFLQNKRIDLTSEFHNVEERQTP